MNAEWSGEEVGTHSHKPGSHRACDAHLVTTHTMRGSPMTAITSGSVITLEFGSTLITVGAITANRRLLWSLPARVFSHEGEPRLICAARQHETVTGVFIIMWRLKAKRSQVTAVDGCTGSGPHTRHHTAHGAHTL